MTEEKTIEELESQHKALVARRELLQNNINKISAARDERKRTLKETIEECKKEGFNPETLQSDIQHMKNVLSTKMDVISSDLSEAEAIVRPMLKEIERG